MYYAIAVCLGIVVGLIASRIIFAEKSMGFLRLDKSDPYDTTMMFLELRADISQLVRKKYIRLQVKQENYISRD